MYVQNEAVHITADGRKLLVTHGDDFDGVVQYAKWLTYLCDCVYDGLLSFNHFLNVARCKLGYPYWSLSAYLKHKVKNAANFISNFEQALADEAKRRNLDGIVCGHIHHAKIRHIDGILYCNDGDWVESCTALVEDWDGHLSIIYWTEQEEKNN